MEVTFLGHAMSADGIQINPKKIEGFSLIAVPLTKLLRKNTPFVWTDKQQSNFEKFKYVLTQAQVLIQPESGKEFVVFSDASHVDLGCVLM